MKKLTITAPAKINLMLDVTGKRPDGYHTLVTIMQSVSLCDTVYISKSSGITVKCSDASIPCDERNIAYKAAAEFFKTAKIGSGADIEIVKRIPLQAGLGGGSADGAAVIVGLDRLYGTNYTIEELCKIGAKVGADVSFCIVGGTMLCKGIGEEISPVPPLEPCYIVIAKGQSGISTKDAYQKIDNIPRDKSVSNIALYDGTIRSVSQLGGNIFERVTDNKDIAEIKQICTDCGADYSAMSGSGSAVFGLFEASIGNTAAQKCAELLRSKGFFAEVCTNLSYGAKIFDK